MKVRAVLPETPSGVVAVLHTYARGKIAHAVYAFGPQIYCNADAFSGF